MHASNAEARFTLSIAFSADLEVDERRNTLRRTPTTSAHRVRAGPRRCSADRQHCCTTPAALGRRPFGAGSECPRHRVDPRVRLPAEPISSGTIWPEHDGRLRPVAFAQRVDRGPASPDRRRVTSGDVGLALVPQDGGHLARVTVERVDRIHRLLVEVDPRRAIIAVPRVAVLGEGRVAASTRTAERPCPCRRPTFLAKVTPKPTLLQGISRYSGSTPKTTVLFEGPHMAHRCTDGCGRRSLQVEQQSHAKRVGLSEDRYHQIGQPGASTAMPGLAIRRLTMHLSSMSSRRHTGLSPSGFLRAIIDHRLPLESVREPRESPRPINVSVTSFGVLRQVMLPRAHARLIAARVQAGSM